MSKTENHTVGEQMVANLMRPNIENTVHIKHSLEQLV